MSNLIQLTQLPEEISELAKSVNEQKQNEVKNVLAQIFNGTEDWEKQVDGIEIKGVDDKMSIDLAKIAAKNAKDARLDAMRKIKEKREEVQMKKFEFDSEDKLWLRTGQIIEIKFKLIEEKARWKADYVKRFEAEQKALETQNRVLKVAQYVDILVHEFEDMSKEVFEIYLNGLKSAHEQKLEAVRLEKEESEKRIKITQLHKERKEIALPYYSFWTEFENNLNFGEQSESDFNNFIARVKQVKSEHESEQKRIRLENERLKKEAEAKEKSLEIERQKANAEIKAQNEKQARLEAELRAKKDDEIKKEQERISKELAEKKEAEKLAKAPIKKQLSTWVESFSIPEFNTENQTSTEISGKFEAFKKWAIKEVNNI